MDINFETVCDWIISVTCYYKTSKGFNTQLFQTKEPHFKEYQVQTMKNATAMAEALVKSGYTLVSGDNLLVCCHYHFC